MPLGRSRTKGETTRNTLDISWRWFTFYIISNSKWLSRIIEYFMVNSYDFELKGFLELGLRISNLTPDLISTVLHGAVFLKGSESETRAVVSHFVNLIRDPRRKTMEKKGRDHT